MQENFAELRRLVRLALPLVLTQLAQMSLSVADTVMAGQVGSVDLAGVALGTVVFWPLMLLVSGTIMAIIPTVSQLDGAGRRGEAGEVVRQALWIAFLGGICLMVIYRNLTPLYETVGVDPLAIPVTAAYLDAMSVGVMPLLGYFCMRYLCEGLGWTLPAMLIAGSALLLKIPLNYWFIHGGLGVPSMGGVGCGWASVVVYCYQLLAMIGVILCSRMRVACLFNRFSRPDWPALRRLVLLGVPIGSSIFAEYSIFSALTLLIGRLGVDNVAAHQIASNVGGLTFMIPLAIGMAASIRVGFNVGAGNLAAAGRSGWVALSMSLAFAGLAALILATAGDVIAAVYTKDFGVQVLAVQLLVLVAIYQPVDNVQGTAIGALRGFKDTRVPFFVAVGAYWLIGFPTSWALGFGYFEAIDFGIYGYWMGLMLGLTVAAVVLVGRFVYLTQRADLVSLLARR
ncbi:MAG: MATE family efflux transporter [Gammaproteobacteria bacterium]|jgi:multidrug resistance protein, MATE family|nr:MATE family efflux transporter [Gammaproteobacteria bacterium]